MINEKNEPKEQKPKKKKKKKTSRKLTSHDNDTVDSGKGTRPDSHGVRVAICHLIGN